MTAGTGPPAAPPEALVEELLRTLGKSMRAFQMYLPNNPMYQRAEAGLRAHFAPVWEVIDEIILGIGETDITWDDVVVYSQPTRSESFAWTLYKDGMRWLTLTRGVEEEEIFRFLRLVNRARVLTADAGDDLLTLLWEEEFAHLRYQFAEVITDAVVLDPHAADLLSQAPPDAVAAQERVRQDPSPPARALGVVDPDDFDSTLYFLDDAEIASLSRQVEEEYSRDVRGAAFDAILDVFELVEEPQAVRVEVLGILEALFPNLLNQGDFLAVGALLRELNQCAERSRGLDPDTRRRLEAFESRLSEPAIVAQLITAMEEMGDAVSGQAIEAVLRELRAPALETILANLPKVSSPAVREVLIGVSERLARANAGEVLRLLSSRRSEALHGLVLVCGRLELQAAVPGLTQLLKHEDPSLRVVTVEALGAIGSPGALAALEPAIDDDERTVRVAAVGIVGQRGYKGAMGRLEAIVTGKRRVTLERSEKLQCFEAYAAIAGPGGLPVLAGLLLPRGLFRLKESAETRTCAAYAIGRIRTPEAREILRQAEQDKELTVRNAVSRALREWQP